MRFRIIYIVKTAGGVLETFDKGAAVLRMADAKVSGTPYSFSTRAVPR